MKGLKPALIDNDLDKMRDCFKPFMIALKHCSRSLDSASESSIQLSSSDLLVTPELISQRKTQQISHQSGRIIA
jgi:hypothetical protein